MAKGDTLGSAINFPGADLNAKDPELTAIKNGPYIKSSYAEETPTKRPSPPPPPEASGEPPLTEEEKKNREFLKNKYKTESGT